MRKIISSILIILSTIVLTSCASSRGNIKISSVKKGEGIFYGKIKVVMDDEDVTGNCYVGTKDPSGKRVYYSLDDSGLYSGVSKKGQNWLGELRCRKGMSHYAFFFPETDHTFKNVGNNKKTYFGDVTVIWETKYDVNSKALMLLGGFGGGIAASTPQDNSKLKFIIKDNYKKTTELFQSSQKEKDSLAVYKSLMSMPKVRGVASAKDPK